MKTIRVEVSFDIGDYVYLPTDENQSKWIVLGYCIRNNDVLYDIYSHNSGTYVAYGFELSKEKEIV